MANNISSHFMLGLQYTRASEDQGKVSPKMLGKNCQIFESGWHCNRVGHYIERNLQSVVGVDRKE
jgi:hypothetical protein